MPTGAEGGVAAPAVLPLEETVVVDSLGADACCAGRAEQLVCYRVEGQVPLVIATGCHDIELVAGAETVLVRVQLAISGMKVEVEAIAESHGEDALVGARVL